MAGPRNNRERQSFFQRIKELFTSCLPKNRRRRRRRAAQGRPRVNSNGSNVEPVYEEATFVDAVENPARRLAAAPNPQRQRPANPQGQNAMNPRQRQIRMRGLKSRPM